MTKAVVNLYFCIIQFENDFNLTYEESKKLSKMFIHFEKRIVFKL